MYILSYTRVSSITNTGYPLETLGVMKRKSTVENYGLWAATQIDLKELPRIHPAKRICGV